MLEDLSKAAVSRRDVLMKSDVKDFYLSGGHHVIAMHASSFIDEDLRNVSRDAVLHILWHQFVEMGEQVYRLHSGSGMGFMCSGELADATFVREVEDSTTLNPSWRERWGIKFYARCKDDCMWVLRPPEGRRLLGVRRDWEKVTKQFVIDEWEASMTETEFLDVTISKPVDCDVSPFLEIRPCWKQTSLGVPLSTSSFHPHFIHIAWMKGEIRRLSTLSSSFTFFENAKRTFINRLQKFHCNCDMLKELQEYDPYTEQLMSKCLGSTTDPGRVDVRKLVMVLPYHSGLYASRVRGVFESRFEGEGLSDIVRSVWRNWPYKRSTIGWKLTNPHWKDAVKYHSMER